MPDRKHAAIAKAYAAHASPAVRAQVDAKANAVLGHPHKNLGAYLQKKSR